MNSVEYQKFKSYQLIMDYVTCASCVGLVTSYINFATTCEGTEEKIILYHEIHQYRAIIKLSDVLAFLDGDKWYSNVNLSKEVTVGNLEYSFKESPVKVEVELLDSSEQCNRRKSGKTYQYETGHGENLKRHLLGRWDITEVQMYKCDICEYRTKYKGVLKRHLLVHKDISEVQTYKCDIVNIRPNIKELLNHTC
ncbi:hypothetical protein NQ317_016635 [Molorchus minor]|uniref:C2H2-type domain-containing protein n=1 Tax=Molorchus minor TaxID=1323400 RepID=A0ABQ9IYR9_9CUCU|nr:hypothetical protein NQ317_016635 [Molorchus minor]